MNKVEEILKMVKENTITVDEASKLLAAVGNNEVVPVLDTPQKMSEDYHHKMLKILVDSVDGDVVRVSIPVTLVLAGIDLAAKFNNVNINDRKIDTSQIDTELIKEFIQSGMLGEIVSIESANGDHVRIFVE